MELKCDLHLPSSFDFHGIEMSFLTVHAIHEQRTFKSRVNRTMNVRYRLHVRTMYVPYVVAVHIRESLFSGFASYKLQVAPENRWRNFHFSKFNSGQCDGGTHKKMNEH